jgi:CBS domain-containing protein
MSSLERIADCARRRLAVLNRGASIVDASRILANPDTPLAVVCDAQGVAIGVLSRMDIVKVFSRADNDAFATDAESVMTRSFLSCRESQSLQEAWDSLNTRRLRCAPLLDEAGRPLGVVHARELVRALLDEVSYEEMLLRDYVLGVGYR